MKRFDDHVLLLVAIVGFVFLLTPDSKLHALEQLFFGFLHRVVQ